MDDNRCLNEILYELRRIRDALNDISRNQKELENIKNEIRSLERKLERRG